MFQVHWGLLQPDDTASWKLTPPEVQGLKPEHLIDDVTSSHILSQCGV